VQLVPKLDFLSGDYYMILNYERARIETMARKVDPELPRVGRPSRAGSAADVVLSLRLTAAERELYRGAAKTAGVPLAEWARLTLSRAAARSKR
jgi:hypothetical protein